MKQRVTEINEKVRILLHGKERGIHSHFVLIKCFDVNFEIPESERSWEAHEGDAEGQYTERIKVPNHEHGLTQQL